MRRSTLAVLAGVLAAASPACFDGGPTTDANNVAARCSEAADALASCTDIDPIAFAAECAAADAPDAFALIDELVESECPATIGKADDLTAAGFVALCGPVVVAAALQTRLRNLGNSRSLTAADHALLRRHVGPLVDDVTFVFGARMIDRWNIAGLNIQFAFDIAAQTFGDRIYVERAYAPGDAAQLKTLAHELAHSVQSRSAGGLVGFAYDYCAAFYQSGWSYSRNALESQARRDAAAFAERYL